MRGSGRLLGLPPLPSVPPASAVSPRWDVAPQQPQPLPGAHLALTFPGAPSMPAGCHSRSKSYKQNEEKSLISIYSNEPCNNANHKSCSHCYSISVSYPSPHTFPGCLGSSPHSPAPSQPGDPEQVGRGPSPPPGGHLGRSHLRRHPVAPQIWGGRCPAPRPRGRASPGAGSVPGLAELRPEAAAPNPGWYLRRSLGSIKREKLSPELISVPWFNPGARLPVSSPGAEFSAGERRGPVPTPRPP